MEGRAVRAAGDRRMSGPVEPPGAAGSGHGAPAGNRDGGGRAAAACDRKQRFSGRSGGEAARARRNPSLHGTGREHPGCGDVCDGTRRHAASGGGAHAPGERVLLFGAAHARHV